MNTTAIPIPLEEALAAIDSPEAVADRNKRANRRAEGLRDRERQLVIDRAGSEALARALEAVRQRSPASSTPRPQAAGDLLALG